MTKVTKEQGEALLGWPPLPNFHKTYREYREWMAKFGPMSEVESNGWLRLRHLYDTHDKDKTP